MPATKKTVVRKPTAKVPPMFRNFDPATNPSIVTVKKLGKLAEIQITLDPKIHAKKFKSGKKGFYSQVYGVKVDGKEMMGQVMLYEIG